MSTKKTPKSFFSKNVKKYRHKKKIIKMHFKSFTSQMQKKRYFSGAFSVA